MGNETTYLNRSVDNHTAYHTDAPELSREPHPNNTSSRRQHWCSHTVIHTNIDVTGAPVPLVGLRPAEAAA